MRAPGWLRWVVLPLVAGAVLGSLIDPLHLPLIAGEQLEAVLLQDGQAYFGHLEDLGFSDDITLRDVYYLQDARATTTELPVALVKRGSELHGPADGMRIRRDRVLAIEQVGPASAVARAIAVERAIERGAR